MLGMLLPLPHMPPPLTAVVGSYRPLSRADHDFGVQIVHFRLWNEHVTDGSAGVVKVTLIQNPHRVPHVAVHEVNPEVGVCQCPPPQNSN